MALLEVKNLQKIYTTHFGAAKVEALRNISFSVEGGEFIAIMGESGSGKTTLLNILATLDKATAGDICMNGKSRKEIKEGQLANYRRDNLGFVFQDFNLLNNFSVRDNILLPLVLQERQYAEMEKRLQPLARKLEILPLLDKYPYEISGGQKQRAAAARALITNPLIVFADEPTGALDSRSAEALLQIFEQINNEGQTILMVTHSISAASHAQRVLFLRDGQIYHQLYRKGMSREQYFAEISETLSALMQGGML